MGIKGEDAIHLLLSVAVLGEEMSRQASILHFHLSAHHLHPMEEGLHPVIDARTHDEHLCIFCLRLFHHIDPFGPEQVLIIEGKQPPLLVKILEGHAFEEISKHLLFHFPVGILAEFHQHQQRAVSQESFAESLIATGIADKLQERIAPCQRSVEVEGIDLIHSLGDGI